MPADAGGRDCAGTERGIHPTLESCVAAHAGCDATLCVSSGGAWHNRLEWCGHFTCGVPAPDACETPTRARDCGTYRVFMVGPSVRQRRLRVRHTRDLRHGARLHPEPSCDVRDAGEGCDDTGLCGGGTVCCATGGASAASTCGAPLCDDPAGICGPPRPS